METSSQHPVTTSVRLNFKKILTVSGFCHIVPLSHLTDRDLRMSKYKLDVETVMKEKIKI